MKQILFATLLSILPFVSHAVTADSFECSMTVKDDLTGESNTQSSSFQIARMPLSESPAPDVRLTAGQIKFNGSLVDKSRFLTASYGVTYNQAIRLDPTGHEIDPRQTACVTFDTSACTISSTRCLGISTACGMYENPYDPKYGWAPVPFAGGVPAFSDKILTPVTKDIEDENQKKVGTATVSCHYTGTYQ